MKSTHSGTCQICGSKQKLPDGVIANHGYKVQWNQFLGICIGSGLPPFEISKDFVAEQVASAEVALPEAKQKLDAANQAVAGSPADKNLRDVAGAMSRRYHGIRSFIAFQKPRCEKWAPRALTPVPAEAAVEVKRKSRLGLYAASRRLKDIKHQLSRAIDAFSTVYIRNTRDVGLPFHESLYYSQPNSATVQKFVAKVEATNPPAAVRVHLSIMRQLAIEVAAAKADYEVLKGQS